MFDWILAILALGLLIILHEGGHMLVARLCGMRVERFSVGFGKAIATWQRGDTTYQMALVPFGGFVQIAGMNPLEPVRDQDPGSYANKSVARRAATIFAGPAANYALAVLGFFLLAFGPGIGRPYASMVVPGSPAAAAGLQPGDVILAVEGHAVRSNEDVVAAMQAAGGAPVHVTLRRTEPFWNPVFHARGLPAPSWLDLLATDDTREETVTLAPRRSADMPLWLAWISDAIPDSSPVVADPAMARWLHPGEDQAPAAHVTPEQQQRLLAWVDSMRAPGGPYRMGVAISQAEWDRERLSIGASGAYALRMPVAASEMILQGLWQLVSGRVSSSDLSGPVGITKVIKQQFDHGWSAALWTLALLNVYLGLFNLLPWPALDGGRLVFLGYEAATRRRANARVEQTVHAVGFALLLAMLVLVTAKDILHFGG